MPFKLKYYILSFLPFFLLFYSESNSIGGLKISQLWKLPLLLFLIWYVFQKRHKASPVWTQTYYWLSLKHLFNSGMVKQLFGNIQDGLTFLFLPLGFNFCQNAWTKDFLSRFLLCVCQYFILTNIPFLFFGMESKKEGISYGDFQAYTGIFQNQHAMSIIMGICIIVILYNFKLGRFRQWGVILYNVLLLVLGAYSMYLGFARTGWLMCLLGVSILYMPRTMQVRQWIGIAVLAVGLGTGFTVMMVTNKTFHDRILDINAKNGEQRELGSGRGDFIANALELYASGTYFELACGKSMADLKDYEYEKTGMRIFAHNGFATLLATDGAIGVGLEVLALGLLFHFIHKRRSCPSYSIAMASWLMNLSFQLTQGGHIFHFDLLYAMIYSILQLEYEEQQEERLIAPSSR